MKTIEKRIISVKDIKDKEIIIKGVPSISKILNIKCVENSIYIWFMVNTEESSKVDRKFILINSYEQFDNTYLQYIDTFPLNSDYYHLFEEYMCNPEHSICSNCGKKLTEDDIIRYAGIKRGHVKITCNECYYNDKY